MLVGIGVIFMCGVYYWVWMQLLPKVRHYSIRSEVIDVDDNGANTHRILRIPNAEVSEWDATHDELGRKLLQRRRIGSGGNVEEQSAGKTDLGVVHGQPQ